MEKETKEKIAALLAFFMEATDEVVNIQNIELNTPASIEIMQDLSVLEERRLENSQKQQEKEDELASRKENKIQITQPLSKLTKNKNMVTSDAILEYINAVNKFVEAIRDASSSLLGETNQINREWDNSKFDEMQEEVQRVLHIFETHLDQDIERELLPRLQHAYEAQLDFEES